MNLLHLFLVVITDSAGMQLARNQRHTIIASA